MVNLRDIVVGTAGLAIGAGITGYVASQQPGPKYGLHIETTKTPSGEHMIDSIFLFKAGDQNYLLNMKSGTLAKLIPEQVKAIDRDKTITFSISPEYLADAGVELDVRPFGKGVYIKPKVPK